MTIGNFDGVHAGHTALVRAAVAAADRMATSGPRPAVVAMAFWPHPAATLDPARTPPTLMTIQRRTALLREAGADEVALLEPTPALLGQSAQEFIEGLVRGRAMRAIVEGAGFCFGRGRSGDVASLRAMGDAMGFETIVVPPVLATMSDLTTAPVSSTLVRWLLDRGRVRDAGACLGRAHIVEGVVVRGAQRGRDLGLPTANIDAECLAPAHGVYAAIATRPDGERFGAAVSVGTNPQFAGRDRTVEAHLLGWNGPLDDYGWRLELHLLAWLRDQRKFPSVADLVAQIRRDCERAAEIVARAAHQPLGAALAPSEGAAA